MIVTILVILNLHTFIMGTIYQSLEGGQVSVLFPDSHVICNSHVVPCPKVRIGGARTCCVTFVEWTKRDDSKAKTLDVVQLRLHA